VLKIAAIFNAKAVDGIYFSASMEFIVCLEIPYFSVNTLHLYFFI